MNEHTSTPWAKNADGFLASPDGIEVVFSKRHGFIMGDHTPETEANSAFILRACNSYEALVALAKYVAAGHENTDAPMGEMARAALKLAKG